MALTEDAKYKNLGNDCLKNKDFQKAIEFYTKAIEICPNNYLYYSNRSAAHASLGQYHDSLEDAKKVVELNPTWPKGYSRLGTALEYLNRVEEATEAYNKGLAYDPDNSSLKSALNNIRSSSSGQKELFSELFKDPKMQEIFKNPEFLRKMSQYKDNPAAAMSDPQMMQMFSQAFSQNPPSHNGHSNSFHSEEPREPCTSSMQKEPPKKEPTARELAQKEKEEGNKLYKMRMFDSALEKYQAAKELDKETITYDLNISAVYFEQGRFDDCIKHCLDSIERGREINENYKNIAKAFSRIGNVYYKQENYSSALEYYNKSLMEHRDPDVVKKANNCEKLLKELEEKSYIDPAKAEEERKAGNAKFSSGDFPGAIKHYTEAIRRDPKDPKIYSNRAAAYTKIMEYHLCISDCDSALTIDPRFIKAFLRKANALFLMRDFYQAKSVYQKALDIEPNNEEASSGVIKCNQAMSSMKPEEIAEQALRDPEVQQILNDPSMRLILETLKNDPSAASRYFSDPVVFRKLEKLMNAGIIRTG